VFFILIIFSFKSLYLDFAVTVSNLKFFIIGKFERSRDKLFYPVLLINFKQKKLNIKFFSLNKCAVLEIDCLKFSEMRLNKTESMLFDRFRFACV